MGRASPPGAYLRFAGVCLTVCIAISVAFLFVSARFLSGHAEDDAARTTASLIGAPLRQALGDAPPSAPLAADAAARIEAVARPLLSERLSAIDIWTADGQLLYSTRPDAPATTASLPAGTGISTTRAESANGAGSFITFDNEGAYTIQITQDAAAVDATVATLRNIFVVLVVVATIIGFVLIQAAFWFGIRGFSAAHRRLRYLYDTGQEIRSTLDLNDVLTQLTRDSTTLAHGQYGMVTLFDEATGDLLLKTTYDAIAGAIAYHDRRVEEWFTRRAAATNTTIVTIQPVGAYKMIFGSDIDLDGRVALVCVPMSLRDRVVGVVAVVRTVDAPYGSFGPDEVQLVEELAGQAVMAVEQALLFTKMRSYADELETSYDTTLKVLMAALDTKDDVTEGHCERVSKLTVELAKKMDVPQQQLIHIERGALLHDVGKIGVPDAVLKKPASLNKQEWESMQKHPLLAGLIVSKVDFLEGALPILLYHHERYDGQGYPFGLLREKIPLDARIFSVVDSYDAMTSDRPYRSAMSFEEAIAELRRNSGTQFDPDVIEAFESLMMSRPELRNHDHGPHRMSSLHDDHDLVPPPRDAGEHAA